MHRERDMNYFGLGKTPYRTKMLNDFFFFIQIEMSLPVIFSYMFRHVRVRFVLRLNFVMMACAQELK